jgi:SsrA-binding protein
MARKSKAAKGDPPHHRPTINNRQARFRYELGPRWEAGIVLRGSEVKSLRLGQAELREAWVRVDQGEAWLVGCRIHPYSHAHSDPPDPDRPRKLLLQAREIRKLHDAIRTQGLTVIPLRIYFKGSLVKVEIATGKGKKLHDKRETVKRRDAERRARSGRDE